LQITDLYVAPHYRSKGVGAALIAEAERFARQRKAHSMRVTTLIENASARRAYRNLLFRESEVTLARKIPAAGKTRNLLAAARSSTRSGRR
jgi:GNAT superfamily N-acetyltransferase